LVPYTTKLEAATRKDIDEKLIAAGWVVQDKHRINLYELSGVAVQDNFAEKQIWTTDDILKGKNAGIYFDQINPLVNLGDSEKLTCCANPNSKD